MHSDVTSGVTRPAGYRPDIDGMRAVAILSVVAFHVGVPGFEGGFVGVDVFFVISGFLITNLLLGEMRERRSIDLPAFFARRARRLLPAFFLVAVVTLILGLLFLVPIRSEQQQLADSAMAAALYVSNWRFMWARDDYFDPQDSDPLLHTWSLGIEEQFYLVWPLVLLATLWVAHRWQFTLMRTVTIVLSTAIVVSLGYSWWATIEGDVHSAFFAPHSRAWELGVGAFLAVALLAIKQRRGNSAGSLLTVGGIAAITAAVVMFDTDTPYLNIALLVPVLGTAAVIAGVWLAPGTAAAKLLGSYPMVTIGLVSYSWYLWHWPLLWIARAHELNIDNLWRDLGIAILALGLAGLTYVFVENPIRRRRIWLNWSDFRTLGAGATASLLVVAGGLGLHAYANQTVKTEPYQSLMLAHKERGWSRERCRNRGKKLVPKSQCVGSADTSAKYLVIWGDSHAEHVVGAFESANTPEQIVILPRWKSGCPPLTGAVPLKRNAPDEICNQFNSAVLAEIAQLHKADRLSGVVLGGRWSTYLGKPSLAGEAGSVLWRSGRVVTDKAAATALEDSLSLTLQKLAELDVRVLVVAPLPELPFEVPVCLARRSAEFCSVSRALAEDRRRAALQAIKKSTDGFENAYLWDTLPTLCNGGVCLAKRDGIILYSDDDHLSYRGSRWLGPELARSVAWRAVLGHETVCSYDAPAVGGLRQPTRCRPPGVDRINDQREPID